MRLRWMFTDEPFLHVPGGCVLMNRIWDEDFYSDLPVGQVQAVVANYKQDARFKLPPGFKSDHLCHAEWLATGEPWPNDLPPTDYDDYQIPYCCGPATHLTRGGVVWGGSAGDRYYHPSPTSGGVVIGGSVGDVYTAPTATEGGVEWGGSVGDVYTAPTATEGGVEWGGSVGDVFVTPDPTEGGVEWGGEAGDLRPEGGWTRTECGFYTFTAEFTGLHAFFFWGGGGRGGDSTGSEPDFLSGGGGGGGSMAYFEQNLIAGVDYEVHVGCGGSLTGSLVRDTWLRKPDTTVYTAPGGADAVGAAHGAGGLAEDPPALISWAGGDGDDGGPTQPGGGAGSSASLVTTPPPPGTGNNGVGSVGGLPPLPDGGAGGDGSSDGIDGLMGGYPGGGGGGGGIGASGGDGRDGIVIIQWPPPGE